MKPTRADILLIGAILLAGFLIGGALFLFVPDGKVAVVTMDDREVARLPLDTQTEVTVADGYTVVVEHNKAYMKTAPCPDRICVHTPPISRVGEAIVCLPGNVVITVEEASHAP